MVKAIVNPPAPDRRYIQRMGWKGVNVINGVTPTGKFPKAVGSGIFGLECQDSGVFDGPMVPNSGTGIFYNDYAKDTTETQQHDLEWQLLRRPGRPLYPGSSARGIVLIGPSMGNDNVSSNGNGEQQSSPLGKLIAGAAIIGGAYFILSTMLKLAKEGE